MVATFDPEIKKRFTYHPPKDEKQVAKFKVLREYGLLIASTINELCPTSYEKDEAIKKVEEAIMWANASIARNE